MDYAQDVFGSGVFERPSDPIVTPVVDETARKFESQNLSFTECKSDKINGPKIQP